MVKGTVTVTSTGDPALLKKIMADIGKLEVYVGISEETASREDEEINNAELVHIHTHGIRAGSMRQEMNPNIDAGMKYSEAYQLYMESHGSPLWHAPPRPLIEPAIEKSKTQIAAILKTALQAALNADEQGAQQGLKEAGQFAFGEVIVYFDDPNNGWAPNSPATIKAKGSDRPLVDTGALKQAITYVVRDKA